MFAELLQQLQTPRKDCPRPYRQGNCYSGMSVEHLSRRVRSSAIFGNSFLGGLDVSTFFGGRFPVQWIIISLLVVMVYPIVVAVLVVYCMTKLYRDSVYGRGVMFLFVF